MQPTTRFSEQEHLPSEKAAFLVTKECDLPVINNNVTSKHIIEIISFGFDIKETITLVFVKSSRERELFWLVKT